MAAATVLGVCVALAARAPQASASERESDPVASAVTTTIDRAPECGAGQECTVVSTLSASGGQLATPEQLARDGRLLSADGDDLATASTRGAIMTRTWSQQARGLYYFNWTEKHSGRIYWDGTRVWSTTSTAGYKGSHTCDQGSGILFSIKVTKCSTEKIGASALNQWDYFQVHVVAHGVPIFQSHSMHVRATSKGALS